MNYISVMSSYGIYLKEKSLDAGKNNENYQHLKQIW